MSGEKKLSILVTAQNLSKRVLGDVRGDINGVEGAAKRAGTNVGRNVAVGVGLAAAGIATQVHAGVDSLVELERVGNLTEAVIKSTGASAGVTAQEVRGLSEEYEHLTGVDDKVIQNAQNVLLTFTNVKEDAFEPTLEAALNLNAALGGGDESLQGTLLQVAKAINDPVKGMTALRRSSVSFTQEQIDQVKAMVEANDLMGAQSLILGELETQFGGAAAAANQGASRAQKRWADGVEDIQMSLATGFLPLIERVSGKMSELVADPEFLAGVESFGETLASGFDEAIDFAETVDWGAIGSALSTAGTGARAVMDAFLSAPPWLQTAILTGWGLNKLSGGGLGSLVGALGSGLIKGVLGMNAGVVNAKAGVVNVAGGPGVGGPAGRVGGGIGGAAGGGIRGAIAGGGLVGGLATGVAMAAPVLAGVAAVEVMNFQNMRTEATGKLENILDGMPRETAGQIDGSIARLEAQIDQERPLLDGILFNTNVKPVLEAEIAELRTAKAAIVTAQERAATSGAAGFMGLSQKTVDLANAQRSEGAMSRQVMTNRMIEVANAQRSEGAMARAATDRVRATLAAKNFSPTIRNNVVVNTSVSIHEWQRTVQSSQRAYSDNSGGF